jgi:hypothetical protein
MGKLFLPLFKIWIATIIIIAGILAIGFNSYRIMELNAANAFNEQQLFLVREAARGIRELISNIEGTLKIAADILSSAEEHNRSAEKIFSSVLANNQGQMLCMFLANPDGTIIYSYPPQSFSFSADTIGLKSLLAKGAANRVPFISNITTIGDSPRAIFSFVIGVPMVFHVVDRKGRSRHERWREAEAYNQRHAGQGRLQGFHDEVLLVWIRIGRLA